MMCRCIPAVLALFSVLAVAEREGLNANPVRRVVTMLQNMAKKIAAEGERDEELYDKYMCYCKNGAGDLEKSIGAADSKIPQVESAINEAKAQKAQLAADLVEHKADRAAAKEAVAAATALREKEAAAYAKESSDFETNIAALGKAVTALENGMSGTGFLQTSSASIIKRLTISMELSDVDREVLSSFLSNDQSYVPQSGQITGILKEMQSTMEKDLADCNAAENSAKSNFEALVAAKAKEIQANTNAIEKKTARFGEVSVEIVNMEEDLDDTSKALLADKKFLADLDANCATKKEEYAVVQKTRAEEQVAIHETIKILNSDDALDLFKKTLPSPSLLQTKTAAAQVRTQALRALHDAKSGDPRLDLISLALHGKAVNFDKVIKMIDNMVALLGTEQVTDDEKKAYCSENLDKTEDEAKALAQNIDDLEKAIDETTDKIATLADEIKALSEGIKALDTQVADATETRKSEHENYVNTLASDNAAKELLALARNRLNKFYNKDLYVAPPKRELTEAERISTNFGGTMAPTNAPGGISGTGVTAFAEVAPPPPPAAVEAYSKKGEESTGVIAMIDMLVADLDKEVQEMEVEEKDSQAEYETFMADSAKKRAADAASIAEKEGAKADAEAALQSATDDKKSTVKEAMGKGEEISALHGECDWLISNFEARKEARAGEVESLKNAKAVLAGADYSLAQTLRTVNRH